MTDLANDLIGRKLLPNSWVYELATCRFAPLVQPASAYYATFVAGPRDGRDER